MQLERYRRVSCQIWLDQKFLGISDDAKLVFLLILTHPNLTSFGAMKASPASLTDELGWLTERLSEAFREVLSEGLAMYDEKARLLVLPNFNKHNKPASPNVVKSWVHGYKELPECPLKDELYHQLKAFSEGLSEGFRVAFGKAFCKEVAKAVGIQGAGNREQIAEKQKPKQALAASQKPEQPRTQSEAGRACLLMREAGCVTVNPGHPDLLAALAEGVTPEDLGHAAAEAVQLRKAKPFPWAIATARGRMEESRRRPVVLAHRQPKRQIGLADQVMEIFEENQRRKLAHERND